MFKRGETRVPLEKIPALANALKVDPGHLFRLALEQYWPDLGATIATIFGRMATENEEAILIRKWREATKDADPAPTPKIERAVDQMLKDVFGPASI